MSAKKIIPDHLCPKCKSRSVLVEHHILPRALGGSDSLFNKQWLCRECHVEIHQFMRYPKGKRAGIPFFTDVLATYYGKDRTIHEKAKLLETITRIRAESYHRRFLKKIKR